MNIISWVKKKYHIYRQDGKKHYIFSSYGKNGSIINKPYKAYNAMQVYKEGILLHNKLYHENPYSIMVEIGDSCPLCKALADLEVK